MPEEPPHANTGEDERPRSGQAKLVDAAETLAGGASYDVDDAAGHAALDRARFGHRHFFGFTPLMGLKLLLSIAVAWLLRSNKIAAAIAVTLHDLILPFSPAIYLWEYKMGMWVLHGRFRNTAVSVTFRFGSSCSGRPFSPSASRFWSGRSFSRSPARSWSISSSADCSFAGAHRNFSATHGTGVASSSGNNASWQVVEPAGADVNLPNMKPFIAILTSVLLCSCADMHVTKTDVAGGATSPSAEAKDSKGVYMTTNCGVGAYDPKAIYIRPFCIDNAVFTGDQTNSDGEMPIRKALTPVEFAGDLKENLERIAPARILKANETPRTGWLVEGEFTFVDGGSPAGRFFLGQFGVGASRLALHVRVTDVQKGMVVYEFDMYGGSNLQGKLGTVRASGLGRATTFDLVNAAERIYLVLSPNAFRYGTRANIALH